MKFKLGKEKWNGVYGGYQSTLYQKIAKKWRVIGYVSLNDSVSHDMLWERKRPHRAYNLSPVNRVDVRRRIRKGLTAKFNCGKKSHETKLSH